MVEEILGTAPSGWEYTTLGAACETAGGNIQTGPFGSQLHASDYVEHGIPSIMPKDIGDNRVLEEGIARVSAEDAIRLQRYVVRAGDIVYSRRGDVERRAFIRAREDGWLCGTGCLRIRLGESGVDPRYASYFLGHPNVREWVVRHAHGATMANLNTAILSACPLLVPPRKLQLGIGEILGALDDKIDVNRRICTALEEVARSLFQSWFVNFGPVYAKVLAAAERRDPELAAMAVIAGKTEQAIGQISPEIWESLAATAVLFPHEIKDTELGMIPDGWSVARLSDVFDITMGQSPPGESYNTTCQGMPFYQGRTDFGLRFPTARVYCTAPTRYARKGDTLVSVRAPVGDINMAIEECSIGRGIAAIRRKSPAVSFTFYSMQTLRTSFDRFNAEGTVFGSINKVSFERIPVVAPQPCIVCAFERIVGLLDRLIETRSAEMLRLAEARDALLPKLMAGELAIGEVHNA